MVSAIPLAASLVLTSYARNLDEVFGTFSLLYGLTCCILLICANKAIYTYFDRRIPTAVGKCYDFVAKTSIASKPACRLYLSTAKELIFFRNGKKSQNAGYPF